MTKVKKPPDPLLCFLFAPGFRPLFCFPSSLSLSIIFSFSSSSSSSHLPSLSCSTPSPNGSAHSPATPSSLLNFLIHQSMSPFEDRLLTANRGNDDGIGLMNMKSVTDLRFPSCLTTQESDPTSHDEPMAEGILAITIFSIFHSRGSITNFQESKLCSTVNNTGIRQHQTQISPLRRASLFPFFVFYPCLIEPLHAYMRDAHLKTKYAQYLDGYEPVRFVACFCSLIDDQCHISPHLFLSNANISFPNWNEWDCGWRVPFPLTDSCSCCVVTYIGLGGSFFQLKTFDVSHKVFGPCYCSLDYHASMALISGVISIGLLVTIVDSYYDKIQLAIFPCLVGLKKSCRVVLIYVYMMKCALSISYATPRWVWKSCKKMNLHYMFSTHCPQCPLLISGVCHNILILGSFVAIRSRARWIMPIHRCPSVAPTSREQPKHWPLWHGPPLDLGLMMNLSVTKTSTTTNSPTTHIIQHLIPSVHSRCYQWPFFANSASKLLQFVEFLCAWKFKRPTLKVLNPWLQEDKSPHSTAGSPTDGTSSLIWLPNIGIIWYQWSDLFFMASDEDKEFNSLASSKARLQTAFGHEPFFVFFLGYSILYIFGQAWLFFVFSACSWAVYPLLVGCFWTTPNHFSLCVSLIACLGIPGWVLYLSLI